MKLLLTLLGSTALILGSSAFAGENCENCKKGEKAKAYMLKKFDANGDGKLSEAERATAKAHRKEMVAKHDTDGDGKLSEAERAAAKAAIKAKKEA